MGDSNVFLQDCLLVLSLLNSLFGCLKNEGSRVKGGKIIQLPYLEIFNEREGGFRGV